MKSQLGLQLCMSVAGVAEVNECMSSHWHVAVAVPSCKSLCMLISPVPITHSSVAQPLDSVSAPRSPRNLCCDTSVNTRTLTHKDSKKTAWPGILGHRCHCCCVNCRHSVRNDTGKGIWINQLGRWGVHGGGRLLREFNTMLGLIRLMECSRKCKSHYCSLQYSADVSGNAAPSSTERVRGK